MKLNIARLLVRDSFAFGTIIAAIIISGIVLTAWMVLLEDKQMREGLLKESELIASAIDVEYISRLRGDSSDIHNPYYHLLKRKFAAVTNANDRYYFIYLLGKKPSGEIFFFVDNVAPGSPEESVAGQIYGEASPELHKVFDEGRAETEGPIVDRWGTFISSMVPVFKDDLKKPVAVFGVDIDAGLRTRQLIIAAIPTVLVTILLLVMLFSATALLRLREKRGNSAPVWMQYLDALLIMAVGIILTAYIAFLSFRKDHADNHESFTRLAESRTAAVAESFRSLKRSQLEGLVSYFASNDFVRKDEFDNYTGYLLKNKNVHAWDWVSVVQKSEVPAYIEYLKGAGLPDFEIWEKDSLNNRIPVKDRPFYYPVTYITPGNQNEIVSGFDQNSDSVRARACREALMSPEKIAVTDPVVLTQDSSEHHAMVVFRPVFKNNGAKHIGFAVAVVRTGELIKNTISDLTGTNIEISLINQDGTKHRLDDYVDQEEEISRHFKHTRYVFAFGRVFSVTAFANKKMPAFSGYRSVWIALFSGFTLTFSFVFVLWFFVRTRIKLEKLVEERTTMLRESESKFRQVTEQMTELVLILSQEGIIEYASPAAMQILGTPAKKLNGSAFIGFIADCDVSNSLYAYVKNTQRESRILYFESLMKREDNTLFYGEITATDFNQQGRMSVLLTIRDVTTRYKAQQELLISKEEAEESDKLKTRFLQNISQEMRAPMNRIIGMLEQIKRDDLSKEERELYISMINKTGQQVSNTIEDIIELSKIETGKLTLEKEWITVSNFLSGIYDLFTPVASEKMMKFNFVPVSEHNLKLFTDKAKLHSILVQLLRNAFKFSRSGMVQMGCFTDADQIFFFVRDTGIGIPADRQQAIFERFVQLDSSSDRQFEGAGVGLSIVAAFAKALNATITVESEVDKGSEFTVCMPLHP